MIERAITATNAAKAVVAIFLNAAIEFLAAFNIYDLSDRQQGALTGVVNAVLLGYVLLTYTRSAKRAPGA